MDAITASNSINKAQAVLASLIESCYDLDPSEIKTNLSIVNDFLCNALDSSELENIHNPLAFSTQPARENTSIGDRACHRRKDLGLSEADLARQLNTYSNHISNWECGIIEPPVSMIIPLANILKCDPLWLLTGNNAENNQ